MIREKIVELFDKLLEQFRRSKAFGTDTLENLSEIRTLLILALHTDFIPLHLP